MGAPYQIHFSTDNKKEPFGSFLLSVVY